MRHCLTLRRAATAVSLVAAAAAAGCAAFTPPPEYSDPQGTMVLVQMEPYLMFAVPDSIGLSAKGSSADAPMVALQRIGKDSKGCVLYAGVLLPGHWEVRRMAQSLTNQGFKVWKFQPNDPQNPSVQTSARAPHVAYLGAYKLEHNGGTFDLQPAPDCTGRDQAVKDAAAIPWQGDMWKQRLQGAAAAPATVSPPAKRAAPTRSGKAPMVAAADL